MTRIEKQLALSQTLLWASHVQHKIMSSRSDEHGLARVRKQLDNAALDLAEQLGIDLQAGTAYTDAALDLIRSWLEEPLEDET